MGTPNQGNKRPGELALIFLEAVSALARGRVINGKQTRFTDIALLLSCGRLNLADLLTANLFNIALNPPSFRPEPGLPALTLSGFIPICNCVCDSVYGNEPKNHLLFCQADALCKVIYLAIKTASHEGFPGTLSNNLHHQI